MLQFFSLFEVFDHSIYDSVIAIVQFLDKIGSDVILDGFCKPREDLLLILNRLPMGGGKSVFLNVEIQTAVLVFDE